MNSNWYHLKLYPQTFRQYLEITHSFNGRQLKCGTSPFEDVVIRLNIFKCWSSLEHVHCQRLPLVRRHFADICTCRPSTTPRSTHHLAVLDYFNRIYAMSNLFRMHTRTYFVFLIGLNAGAFVISRNFMASLGANEINYTPINWTLIITRRGIWIVITERGPPVTAHKRATRLCALNILWPLCDRAPKL